MKIVRGSIVALLTMATISLGALQAEATPLTPGSTVVPGTVLTGFGGTELDSVFHSNVGNDRYRVDVAAAVYRNAAGTLDFYYQVTNRTGSLDALRRATMSAFGGFLTDVFQVSLGTSIGCKACGGTFRDGTQAAATADRSLNGDVVGFNYGPPGAPAIQPGETTLVMTIRTNATLYEVGNIGVINGKTIDLDAFQPAVVPEPASLALFGLGLLGTTAAIRRRRNRTA